MSALAEKVNKAAKRFFSIGFDFILVLFSFHVLDSFINCFFWFPFWLTFALCYALYYFVGLSFFRTTIGNQLFGFRLKSDKPITRIGIAIRCFLETLVLWIMPSLIAIYLYRTYYESITFLLFLIFYYLIIGIIHLIAQNPIWNWLFSYRYCPEARDKRQILQRYILTTLAIFLGFFATMLCNNIHNPGTDKFCGFKMPFKMREYPENRKAEQYAEFMRQQEDAKDYLLGLFEQNDIVVLEETFHDAIPQWDFIYEVVSDPRFIQAAGTVFIEYGDIKYQADIDSFLVAQFDSDSAREKALMESGIFRLEGYNLSNFFRRVNQLNTSLPDSQKISIRYTNDMHQGKYFSTINFDTLSPHHNEDSVMANIVIEWYRNFGRKCLVVTNTRHATILHHSVEPGDQLKYYKLLPNEANLIHQALPDQTVNVFYYGDINFLGINRPAHGLWRTAFRLSGKRPIGFDLQGTDFGKTYYSMIPLQYSKIQLQEMFDGIIFNGLEEDVLNQKTFSPMSQHAVLHEYKQRLQSGEIDSTTLLNLHTYQDGGARKPTLTIDEILQNYAPKEIDQTSKSLNWTISTGALLDCWIGALLFLLLWIPTTLYLLIRLAIPTKK